MAYDYITYDEYQAFDPMSKLTDCEFTDLLVPVCRVIDAMLFHAIALGRVTPKHRLWDVIKLATCMQMSYAYKSGAEQFLRSDGRQIASEGGAIGGVSDSVTYQTDDGATFGVYGGYPASREAYSVLSSSGLIGNLRVAR